MLVVVYRLHGIYLTRASIFTFTFVYSFNYTCLLYTANYNALDRRCLATEYPRHDVDDCVVARHDAAPEEEAEVAAHAGHDVADAETPNLLYDL